MEKNDTDLEAPSLKQKLISGANWGMLAGFWVELPILVRSAFRETNISKWTARLVLPATLVGLIYGWTRPAREQHRLQEKMERLENDQPLQMQSAPRKSWAAAEQSKQEVPQEIYHQ